MNENRIELKKDININEDRRVRRTRRQIHEALLRLMKKKHIQKISVKELAEEADVTRSTFYQHYSDPTEVLEQMQKTIIAGLQDIIDHTTSGDSVGFFRQMCEYLAQEETHAEILSLDGGYGRESGFEVIGKSIHQNYMLRWGQKFTEEQTKMYEYYRYYIVFGCIAVIENWLENGRQETPEQMAVILASLLPKERMYLKADQSVGHNLKK